MQNNKKNCKSRITRRKFIGAAASVTAFTIVPRHVLGGPGRTAPSEKLNIACIGVGGKGFDDVRNVMSENIVAICDVDTKHAADAFKMFSEAKKYSDYRRMLDEEAKNIDAVVVATPDHVHIPARFVKVTHNGTVIQENQEVKYASGTNWDRKQVPQGPIIIQGDYGPIALRNVRMRDWKAGAERQLNMPPKRFTALFNGKDFTGWRMSPKAKRFWSIEDGVLKSHGLLKEWGACLATEKEYRDFVLLLDFRMPTKSDSGINFRRLIPNMGNFGQAEQFNLRSKGGMGHLESFYFMPKNIKKKMGLKEKDIPKVKYIDPEVGVWHTVKLTVIGKNVTAEYDGEVIIDKFEYPEGILSLEPAIIRLQKHVFVNGDNLGEMNPCPIEFRNLFIKEIKSSE